MTSMGCEMPHDMIAEHLCHCDRNGVAYLPCHGIEVAVEVKSIGNVWMQAASRTLIARFARDAHSVRLKRLMHRVVSAADGLSFRHSPHTRQCARMPLVAG